MTACFHFTGRNFLNRATLSLSIEEIRKVLSTVPCSSGFSLNVGSLEELEISNFEVSAVDGFVETKITGYGYHFNMYVCMCTCVLAIHLPCKCCASCCL